MGGADGMIFVPTTFAPLKPSWPQMEYQIRELMREAFAAGWSARNNLGKLTQEDVTDKIEMCHAREIFDAAIDKQRARPE
jgi:hypothetical protein